MRGGGQIRGVDDGDGFAGAIHLAQQRQEQMVIDRPELHGIQTIPKLVQHLGIGQDALVGQAGEVPPRAVFGQELDQQVKRMDRRQEMEQQDPEELCGPKQGSSAPSALTGKEIVEGIVVQMGRERL
jgi:hypothetical protein